MPATPRFRLPLPDDPDMLDAVQHLYAQLSHRLRDDREAMQELADGMADDTLEPLLLLEAYGWVAVGFASMLQQASGVAGNQAAAAAALQTYTRLLAVVDGQSAEARAQQHAHRVGLDCGDEFCSYCNPN